jgi:DNA polymerase III epsilon subunit-like protein
MFSRFVKPTLKHIPPMSSAIHNIRDADVEGAAGFVQVVDELVAFFDFDSYDAVEFIAHNNDHFDEIVMRKELPPDHAIFHKARFWDSLPFLRSEFPGLDSYALGNIYQHFFGEPFANAHRADADVRALRRLYVEHIEPRLKRTPVVADCVAALERSQITGDCLTSVRYIGPYRASLLNTQLAVTTVAELKAKFTTEVALDPLYADRALQLHMKMGSVAQRMAVLAAALDIALYDDALLLHVARPEEGVLDAVDYYVKYRFGLDIRPPRAGLYQRGLLAVVHKDY